MSARLNQKLADCLDKGDFYEAHQIYRTIYFRLAREHKFSAAYRLLVAGATKLLSSGQANSGADLANLLVEMLAGSEGSPAPALESQLQVSEEALMNDLRQLFAAITPDSPERAHFVSKALSIAYLPTPALRTHLALVLWREKNYAESRLHFVYSGDSGENVALMLVEYHLSVGFPGEVDLMIAQFVLQVLAAERKQLAAVAFKVYTARHPAIEGLQPPFLKPLLNFIFFLLSAIDNHSKNANVFNVLCALYEKSLNRDPCYKEYLCTIGEIYFGQEKKQKTGGLFSNLFQSLFNNNPEGEGGRQDSFEYSVGGVSGLPSTITSSAAAKNEDVDLD